VIVCLVPVLGRPHLLARVAESLRKASPKVRLVFICSADREEDVEAARDTKADVFLLAEEPEAGDFAKKIALGYAGTSEEWIFQGATDITFGTGWDDAALSCAAETGAKVVGTNDMANPAVMNGRHSTHTLIARDYCDEPGASFDGPGTVFSTAYDHQSVDVELIELAKMRGVWTFCREAIVLHHHPFFDKSVEMDATYEKGLAKGRQDHRLFAVRRKQWMRAQR
jgi:hypothetical protein